jgi:hypothetical protein
MVLNHLRMHAAGIERLIGWRSRFRTGGEDANK